MISAVVLTKNEEENIKDCLEKLTWCNEIIVVDDYSQDKTREIAKNLGAKVFRRYLNNDFAAQRNFALKKAKNDWVLFVDSDERVPKQLALEIQHVLVKDKQIQGYHLKRQDFVFSKFLKHGETAKVKLLRLAKRRAGWWVRPVHEVWQVKGRKATLKTPLLHYPHKNIAQFLKSINTYTAIHAQALFKEGQKSSFWQIFIYPTAKFFRNYLWHFGFLDGMPGFIHALLMSFHSFLVRGKLWLLHR